ncbi:hypothetical protein M011DRAFT_462037 [Sporormia fimetaria CBS 119925]|uniref:Transmembrane protein n=1 Tax=Sporormia fimetaria CBS 119925 TaxID=1340428 RepID=A0A6A6UXA3_9PLEO|nr:hypothetical protein M011DRAFT_462037 [Sporormia fimetaria CBS 119925]
MPRVENTGPEDQAEEAVEQGVEEDIQVEPERDVETLTRFPSPNLPGWGSSSSAPTVVFRGHHASASTLEQEIADAIADEPEAAGEEAAEEQEPQVETRTRTENETEEDDWPMSLCTAIFFLLFAYALVICVSSTAHGNHRNAAGHGLYSRLVRWLSRLTLFVFGFAVLLRSLPYPLQSPNSSTTSARESMGYTRIQGVILFGMIHFSSCQPVFLDPAATYEPTRASHRQYLNIDLE